MNQNVLIVQTGFRDELLEQSVRRLGWSVLNTVYSGRSAIELAEKERPDLVVMDFDLKGELSGLDTADIIYSQYGIPIVFVADEADENKLEQAMARGPFGYILYPFRDFDLKIAIETALRMHYMNSVRISAEKTSREDERLFGSLFGNAKDAVALLKGNKFVKCNPAGLKLFRCEASRLVDRSPWEFSPETQPDGANSREEVLRRIDLAYQGEDQRFEWRYLLVDGTELDCEVMLTRVELSNERYLLVIIHDIAERKTAEYQLLENESIYRKLFEYTVYGLVIADDQRSFLDCNQRFEEMTGYTKENLIGMDLHRITPEKWHGLEKEMVKEQLLKRGFTDPYEKEYIKKDGTVIPVEITLHKLEGNGDRTAMYWGVVHDITQRKLSENQLRKERDFSTTLVQASPAYFVAIGVEGEVKMMNDALLEALGYNLDEVVGKFFLSTFAVPEDRPELAEIFNQIRSNNYLNDHETRLQTRDGRQLVVVWNGRQVAGLDGRTEYFYGVGIDITERKKAEEAIRESEKKYRGIYESAPVGIFRSITAGEFLDVNPYIVRMLGYDSSEEFYSYINQVGMERGLYANPEDRSKMVEEVLNRHDWFSFETQLLHKSGRTITCGVKIRSIGEINDSVALEGFIEDITERRQAEKEKRKLETLLTQAQKMEAIGALAGGIAHDLNNILSPIIAFTELAKMSLVAGEEADGYLGEVLKAGLRARDLVKHILTFSRQTDLQKRAVQLSPLVKETLKFLRASLPSTIEIRTDLDIADSMVFSDPSQIHQVVMNLCTNAAHAMKETGGVLEVHMKEVTVDDSNLLPYLELNPGGYIKMIVSDTGRGIPKNIIGRIFDPFFTTKERGEGTGLGLSVVHGIVKDMGGAISVYSETGTGAAFHVFLPKCEEKGGDLVTPDYEIIKGKGRILFVDDEERIIMAGLMILENLGYEVMTTTSSIEALEIFKSDPQDFDLVLTDVTMPKMTGLELSRHLIEIRPDIPILLCTGFSDTSSQDLMRDIGIKGIVLKPMIIKELAEAIHNAISREKG